MSPMTSAETFAACEKTDRIFHWILGRTLQQAVIRIVAIGGVGCAAVVTAAALVM
ncbi:MAG TPA: hypothetical protein VJR71_13460 [Pseudolabrys sp.]|nr:hypothetical protein [Pseudolabrys sp.]